MRKLSRLSGTLLWLALSVRAGAGELATAVPAPEWAISEWIHEDPGSLADQRGRVVLIDFFQLWCPGCNRFSIPLFSRWEKRYAGRDDVRIVSIHTVFEGHEYQTPERLREFVEGQPMRHAVGIDAYAPDDPRMPITMRSFRTRGTPHVAIVDKQGRLRFSHFGSFDPKPVEELIERLLAEPGDPPTDPRDGRGAVPGSNPG